MKKSFINFWNRSIALVKLGILSNIEYRFNFLVDVVFQPFIASLIEWLLWWAIFTSSGSPTIMGYDLPHYLAYSLWATFFARITINWMYEFKMISDIVEGKLNIYLSRPISFYEYYWNQFFGYKVVCLVVSFCFPMTIHILFLKNFEFWRLPLSLMMVLYYLLFSYTLSFCVATLSLKFSRIYSITVAKNIAISILDGSFIPLDLFKSPWRGLLTMLPFACGGFYPAGFLAGRVSVHQMAMGFLSITVSLFFVSILAHYLWTRSLKLYTGTGA